MRLSLSLLSTLAFSVGMTTASAQLSDPIPGSIAKGDLSYELEDWLTLPASSSGSTRARLSVMKPAYDGSGRIFINDLRGAFYVIVDDTVKLFANLNDVFPNFIDSPRLGTGFHSFAFHPDFENNGKFYTAHTEPDGSGSADFGSPTGQVIEVQSVVTEWTMDNPAADEFSGSRREVLRVEYAEFVHNIQGIDFNHFVDASNENHGLLYVCVGDGAAVDNGFPEIGHRLDAVNGTLLRIDPLGTDSANGRYGIPASNPFADDGDAATIAEIYAWGFRNPHRICWDSANPDRLFLFDIGEKGAEEVNLITKGGDYGYSVREGTFLLDTAFNHDVVFPLPADDGNFDYVYPVAQYDHDEGRAIAGGQVYRGSRFPDLQGKLIFGDIVNGRVFYVEADDLTLGTQATIRELQLTRNNLNRSLLQIMGDSRADLRIGVDAAGEIYLTTKRDGKIRRFQAAVPEPDTGTGQLLNISTRGQVNPGEGLMTGGFVISERATPVLIRGIGPALAEFGVAGTLADPVLALVPLGETDAAFTNDNWSDETNAADIATRSAAVGAFALTEGSDDAAMLITLDPGSYTVQLTGKDGGTGIALVEVYQVE